MDFFPYNLLSYKKKDDYMQKKRERLREEKGKREYKYDVHVE